MYRILFFIFITTVLCTQVISQTTKNRLPFFESETLFNPLTDGMGYHNYRIPSLLITEKGTILAVDIIVAPNKSNLLPDSYPEQLGTLA
jgi:hypothetical protein